MDATSALRLDEYSGWCLVAQGNRYAVFSASEISCSSATCMMNTTNITGPTSISTGDDSLRRLTCLCKKVLRIEKDTHHHSYQLDQCYLQVVSRPWIGNKYICTTEMTTIRITTHQQLLASIKHSPQMHSIPSAVEEVAVFLEPDLTHLNGAFILPSHLHQSESTPSSPHRYEPYSTDRQSRLTFELKLKCGFRSISPFLVPSSGTTDVDKNTSTSTSTDNATSRLLKLNYSRFVLMQYAKMYKQSVEGTSPRWGEIQALSAYQPLYLLSRQSSLMRQAIQSLFCTPQNNLKVLSNSRHIFGWDIKSTDSNSDVYGNLIDKLIEFLPESESISEISAGMGYEKNASPVLNAVTDSIVAVLEAEGDLLQNILELQALDILDVEGVKAIYSRLCRLNDQTIGSDRSTSSTPADSSSHQSCIDTLLEQYHATEPLSNALRSVMQHIAQYRLQRDIRAVPDEETVDFVNSLGQSNSMSVGASWQEYIALNRLDDSSFGISESSTVTDQKQVRLLLTCMDLSASSKASEEDLTLQRRRADEWVESLDQDDCLFLLRCWLVALSAKDISIMLTIQKQGQEVVTSEFVTDVDPMKESAYRANIEPTAAWKVAKLQSESRDPGVLIYRKSHRFGSDTVESVTKKMKVDTSIDRNDRMTSDMIYYAYNISAIDVGPKPISKITAKIKEEWKLCMDASTFITS